MGRVINSIELAQSRLAGNDEKKSEQIISLNQLEKLEKLYVERVSKLSKDEMLLGINYAVRNVTAHEMRINWDVNEDEAINILSIISSLHKVLDKCQFVMQSV